MKFLLKSLISLTNAGGESYLPPYLRGILIDERGFKDLRHRFSDKARGRSGRVAPQVLPAGGWRKDAPTCRRCQHVRGIPQSHEVKLVEPPVLLVGGGHRVLPPLVHNLVAWVAV